MQGLIDSAADTLMQNDDYMGQMYKRAWTEGSLALTVAWYIMFFQTIGFLISYFRRLLMVLFLIAIFPLVMISYAIDKVADKKSQVFDTWVNEFLVNVFNQSFHAIAYAILMMLVFGMMGNLEQYWLFVLIAIGFISKGDDFLRAIFKMKSSAETMKSVGQSIGETVAFSRTVSGARGLLQKAQGLGGKLAKPAGAVSDYLWQRGGNRANRTKAELDREEAFGKLDALDGTDQTPSGLALEAGKGFQEYRDDMQNAVDVLLGKNPNATAEDMINAANKLNEYQRMKGNKNAQDAYNDVMNNLSEEEKNQILSLMQLSKLGSELNDGRTAEVNIKQRIDLIISALRKDANGNLTPQSKAMLSQIVNNGGDIFMAAGVAGMKFNKARVGAEYSAGRSGSRVQENEYFQERDAELQRHKGRGASKAANAKKGAGALSKARDKVGARGARQGKRVVGKAKGIPGRAQADIARRTKKNTAGGVERFKVQGISSRGSGKRKLKPWKRVTSAGGQSTQPEDRMKLKAVKSPKQIQASNLISSKSKDRPKNSDKLSLFVRYGYFSKKIPDANQTPTGTSYASKIPQKQERFKMKAKASRKGLHEYIEEKKETRSYIEEETRQRRKARARKISKSTGSFAIQRNLNEQRQSSSSTHSSESAPSAPVVYSGSSSSSARAVGTVNMNVGAHIANVSGGVAEIQSILQGMDIKQIHYDSDTHTVQVENRNLVDYINTNIKSSGLSDEAKRDMEEAAICASRLINATEGGDTSSELFKATADMRAFSEKYQHSTNPEERALFAEIMRNLGKVDENNYAGTVDKFEIGLRDKMIKQPDMYTGDMAVVSAWNKYDADSQMIDLETKDIDPVDKKYIAMAIECAFLLRDSTTGKYTAIEILNAIQQLKTIKAHFDAMEDCPAKTEAEGVFKGLGSSLEDYESHARIMVLNDPSSVGNNQKIVDECRQYVSENYENIPDILRGGLRYRKEEIMEANNLRYARQIDNSQRMSDDRRQLMRDRYEAQLKAQQAEAEIARIEKEEKKLNAELPSFAWNVAKSTAEAVWDAQSFAASLGVGVVASGASVTGKNNVATEAFTAFFAGANGANALADNVKGVSSDLTHAGETLVGEVKGAIRNKNEQEAYEQKQAQKALQDAKWAEINKLQKVLQEYYYISNKAKNQLPTEQQQELEVRIQNLETLIAQGKGAEADEREIEFMKNQTSSFENGLTQFVTDNHLSI